MKAQELHKLQLDAKQAELDALQAKYDKVVLAAQAKIEDLEAHVKRCQNLLAKRGPSTFRAKWDTLKAQYIAAQAAGRKCVIRSGELVMLD